LLIQWAGVSDLAQHFGLDGDRPSLGKPLHTQPSQYGAFLREQIIAFHNEVFRKLLTEPARLIWLTTLVILSSEMEQRRRPMKAPASTFVMWRAHLDTPKPDPILDSSMWHLL
jgi:hypothetical protein